AITLVAADRPAGADDDDVVRLWLSPLYTGGLGELSVRDPVSGPERRAAKRRRDVQEDATPDQRRHRLDPKLAEATAAYSRLRIDPAVELAVAGHVGQRVDGGARVPAERHQLVRAGHAVSADAVSVPPEQSHPKGWVVRAHRSRSLQRTA